ncbi:hypothetical protein G8E10_14295 [Rhizobiaceae bacterium CRRU44]|uniref:VOC domain-containing protein n=1 Tax=Ferranicluibacter rubi TaxID=2715133 RepID=A0AA43ZIA4_9HYPH|nr:VOC family protein [Ferranicluibacter rubi]NHT76906.1 hypothetical protein [Ferranicluibacter rubi]
MVNLEGTPIWYELMTTDLDGAQKFYADVFGWSIAASAVAGTGDYGILTVPDGQEIDGLTTLPEGAPIKPGWFYYVGVQDVDGTGRKIISLGGIIHMDPRDVPDISRYAMVVDPQGMVVYIMRGDGPRASQAFHATAPRHCGWNELVTGDHKAALLSTAICLAGRTQRTCQWAKWAKCLL